MKSKLKILFFLSILLGAAFYDIVFLGKTLKVTTANSQTLSSGVYGQENNKPKYIPANGTDAPVSEEPIYEFIKQNLRRGILPLWNPHQACGYSLIGMLEIGIFFPLTFIMYLLPNIISWDVLILCRLLFAGFFTFLFMRRLGFKEVPSLCAAIAFMLSGPMVLLQYWTANVDLLLPLLLLTIDQLVKETNRRSFILLAATVASTLFAGHPEHVFLVNAYGAAFFLLRAFTVRTRLPRGKIFLAYFGAYLLGSGLAAVVLLPFLRNLVGEFWNGHPHGTGLLMEEQPDRALSLALPHFFQKENLTFNFTFAGWWGGYLGLLPLAFAFLSFLTRQKQGLNYFLGVMLVIIIGKQYSLPIINWLGHLPILDICRYAIHTPPLAAFTTAVLCGMGARVVLNKKDLFKKGLFFTFVLALIVLIHLLILKNAEHFNISIQASLFALSLLIIFQTVLWLNDRALLNKKTLGPVLVLFIFLELFLYIHREHPKRFDSFAKVPYIEFLKSQDQAARSYGIFWAFYPNTATGFEVDDLGYFLGLVPNRFVDFVNTLIIKDHFQKDLRPPALRAMPIENDKRFILDLLNVKYIIVPSIEHIGQPFKNLVLNYLQAQKPALPVYQGEVMIFERPGALPRAYIVRRVIFEPDPQKSLTLVKRLGPSGREGAIITHAMVPPIAVLINSLPPTDDSTVEIISSTPNEVILKAEMKNAGFVVLSDAYHPDWKVTVNGKKGKIFQTNYLVRSVFVPAGKHEIRYVFSPASFTLGVAVSGFSLLVLLLLIFVPGGKFVKTKRHR